MKGGTLKLDVAVTLLIVALAAGYTMFLISMGTQFKKQEKADKTRTVRLRALDLAARKLGLGRLAKSGPRYAMHHGTIDGFKVLVEKTGIFGKGKLKITLDGANRPGGGIPDRFLLAWKGISGILKGDERGTGDFGFDENYHLAGPRDIVAALMDGHTRKLIEPLYRGADLLVTRGRVSFESPWESGKPEEVQQIVEKGLELARRFVLTSGQVQERLAGNARTDPVPEVRLRNLEALVSDLRGHPQSRESLIAARQDGHPMVRLFAAAASGGGGIDPLAKLLTGSGDIEDASPGSLDRLVARIPPGQLAQTLERNFWQLPEPLQAAALRALRGSGGAAAERLAVKALKSKLGDIELAAAEALGACGTVDAIAPLRAAAAESLLNLPLRRAVNFAIERIKDRLEGAEAGQVALAEERAPEGRVSLARESSGGDLALEEALDGDHRVGREFSAENPER